MHTFLPPAHVELKPWPFWCQLRDPMPGGLPETNADNDCGPESLAMCVKYLTGVEMPAEYVKDVMYGAGYTGYTDVPHLTAFLQGHCDTAATVIAVRSARHLAHTEWSWLRRGRPLIGLFSFSAPGAADGHFRAVIGRGRDKAITADPWTGKRRVETVAEHWSWSKGIVIGIDRRRRLGEG